MLLVARTTTSTDAAAVTAAASLLHSQLVLQRSRHAHSGAEESREPVLRSIVAALAVLEKLYALPSAGTPPTFVIPLACSISIPVLDTQCACTLIAFCDQQQRDGVQSCHPGQYVTDHSNGCR